MKRLCKLGVLEQHQASEWALPSFTIPKKNRSNFWEGNKRLVRKPFPIPKKRHGVARDRRIRFCNSCPMISTWVITPLDWIQMHPKSAPLSFLGENIPTSDYQWVLQVLQTSSRQKCKS
jgi:hypothetical protein